MFFISQFSYPTLIGKFDRIIDRRHALYDAFEINPPLAGIKARITGQLDHALARISDARQTIGNMQKVKELASADEVKLT